MSDLDGISDDEDSSCFVNKYNQIVWTVGNGQVIATVGNGISYEFDSNITTDFSYSNKII